MWCRSTKQRKAAVRRKAAPARWWSGVDRATWTDDGWRPADALGAVLEVTTYPPLPPNPTLRDVFRAAYGATTVRHVFPRRN